MTRTERQQLAIEKWKQSGCCSTIVASTGFGKTNCAIIAIKRVISKNPNIKVLVIVPTDALRKQWIEKLDEANLLSCTDVMIINSAIKKPITCNFLIVDELHRASAKENAKLFEMCKYQIVLGLTATYERLDEREKQVADKYCPVCDIITADEAIQNGWMSPYRMYKVILDVDITEYLKANQEFLKHFSFFNFDFDLAMNCVKNIFAQQKYAKMVNCELTEVKVHAYAFMKALQFRKKFIANHSKKIEVAKKIIEARQDRKIITFDSSIQQCEAYGMGITVHSQKKQKENLELIKKFSEMKSGVIHSSKMLIEGLDCPGLSVAIITGFNSSKINAKQMLGRVVRMEEGKIAEIYVLILKGTVEEKWFQKSQVGQKFMTIDEEELNYVLNNVELNKTVNVQHNINNLFRF